MKQLARLFVTGALLCVSAAVYAGPGKLYSITACPGEDASTEMNISWNLLKINKMYVSALYNFNAIKSLTNS